MAMAQQDLGSDLGDEALIIAAGTKGILTPPINSKSHEGTSSVDESLSNDRKELNYFILGL